VAVVGRHGRLMLTLTDIYDSSHDPATAALPPMLDIRHLDRQDVAHATCPPDIDPALWCALMLEPLPPCTNHSMAGRRR